MSTIDQKRMLKLAGLLKEGVEEWPRSLEEEEEVPKAKVEDLDVPMGYAPGEKEYKWEPPTDREAMESLYSDMYKELHNIRPRWVDFENLSDGELRRMILDLQDDIDQSFEDEKFDREREEEHDASEREIEELEPFSAEEEEFERMPMSMGMGRGASLEETIRAMVRETLLEKAKTFKGKSMRLGGGGRFAKLVDDLKKKGKSEKQAKALAAAIGRKKYGKGKMTKMAAAGKKRATKKED